MKKFPTLFLILFSITSLAQHPGLISLKGIGGNASDAAANVLQTTDGGFIVGFGTRSDVDTGNIDTLFCNVAQTRSIFTKYNSDASVNINELANGLYLVNWQGNDGIRLTYKFVKE